MSGREIEVIFEKIKLILVTFDVSQFEISGNEDTVYIHFFQ